MPGEGGGPGAPADSARTEDGIALFQKDGERQRRRAKGRCLGGALQVAHLAAHLPPPRAVGGPARRLTCESTQQPPSVEAPRPGRRARGAHRL